MVKRFIVDNYKVKDTSIDEKYVNSSYYIGDNGVAEKLCNLLNQLNDENEMLKLENMEMGGYLVEVENDIKVVLLILFAIGKLPFKLSMNEAEAIKRLYDFCGGELLDTSGD